MFQVNGEYSRIYNPVKCIAWALYKTKTSLKSLTEWKGTMEYQERVNKRKWRLLLVVCPTQSDMVWCEGSAMDGADAEHSPSDDDVW